MDAPVDFMRNGRRARASHLISTLGGRLGRDELLAFGAKVGLKPQWLQRRFTAYEHFDVMNSRIKACLQAGAVKVDRRRLVDYVRAKKPVYRASTTPNSRLRRTRRTDRRVDPATQGSITA